MGDSHDISKQVKVYLAVFGALLVVCPATSRAIDRAFPAVSIRPTCVWSISA
jgi:hypothetical protein